MPASSSSILLALRSSGTRTRVALALGALALAALIWSLQPVFGAVLAGSLADADEGAAFPDQVALAQKDLEAHESFLNDRSPFFAPAAPFRTPTTRPRPTGERPPPPPATYTGPAFIGIIGDMAVFDGPVRGGKNVVALGQTGGEVELLALQRPWRAKVRYKNAEFDLNLFDLRKIEKLPFSTLEQGATPGEDGDFDLFGGEADGALFQPAGAASGTRSVTPMGGPSPGRGGGNDRGDERDE